MPWFFDKLISDFEGKYELSHLSKTSNVVCSQHFENGVAKIQGGEESLLSRNEKDAVQMYLKAVAEDEDDELEEDEDESVGYADRILRLAEETKRKRTHTSKYKNISHVVATSNIVER